MGRQKMERLTAHRQFPVASSELNDEEIELLYGSLIKEAFNEFVSDPSYMVDIATSGSQVARRRSRG